MSYCLRVTPAPGRRRGPALEAAIFAAVHTELARVGYVNLTISAVAERAGTAKPVLYRRWPDRPHLVYAAIAHGRHTSTPPEDTGTFRGDLVAWLNALLQSARLVQPETVWGLLAESVNHPDLLATIRSELVAPHESDRMREIVDRAVGRGEIDARRRTARQLRLPSDLLRSTYLLHGEISAAALNDMVDDVILPALR